MQEIWKDITGYEGLYKVSSLGNIMSIRNNKGNYREKYMKIIINVYGYVKIGLYNNKKKNMYLVHRIVAKEFLPNIENKPCVNHINGIKKDNRVENLEWCTNSENNIHAYKIGLSKITENHHFYTNHPNKGKKGGMHNRSKKVIQLSKSGEKIKEWDSIVDVYRELGISNTDIGQCCMGKYGYKTAGGFKWKYK